MNPNLFYKRTGQMLVNITVLAQAYTLVQHFWLYMHDVEVTVQECVVIQ